MTQDTPLSLAKEPQFMRNTSGERQRRETAEAIDQYGKKYDVGGSIQVGLKRGFAPDTPTFHFASEFPVATGSLLREVGSGPTYRVCGCQPVWVAQS